MTHVKYLRSESQSQAFHFVHGLLREFASTQPEATIRELRGSGATEWLHGLWQKAGAEVAPKQPERPVSEEALKAEPIDRDPFHGALVWLPDPVELGESLFALISSDPWGRYPVRYVTLELQKSEAETDPSLFVGEWARFGHVITGFRSAPAPEAFLAAAAELMES
jgi:hypothetical protein